MMVEKAYFMRKIVRVDFIRLRKQEDSERIVHTFLAAEDVPNMINGAALQIVLGMKKENKGLEI